MRAARRTTAPDPAAVLTQATRRAAEQLGLTGAALADALGVSPSYVSRLGGAHRIDPSSPQGERALLLLRLFRGLDAMVGNADACRRWMLAANSHLRGVPAELVRSVEGLVHVT